MSKPASIQSQPSRALPDYLPARMINEFVYCPRLFYYEQVQGVFVESADTIEGSIQHQRVDKEGKGAPPADSASEEPVIARSITLSSERHKVIAKLDLAEFADGKAVPVDYKHGRPIAAEDGYQPWPSERVQLAVQAIVLRANGYNCDEGIIYYTKSRQRVRVVFDETAIGEAERAIAEAWRAARLEQPPPPLVDSPKCPGCSLVGICLPDETWSLQVPLEDPTAPSSSLQLELFEVLPAGTAPERNPDARLLVAARVDKRPLYLNTQGLRVGKNGGVLRINEKETVVQEVRIAETSHVNLMGNIQVSTQAVQALCEQEIPVCYFSQGGWFYGITTGMNTKNVFLRKSQYRLADEPWFCLWLARKLVAGKVRNQRTMMLRNHIDPPKAALRDLKSLASRAEAATDNEELLGIEGNAARIYFGEFSGMLKADTAESPDSHRQEIDRAFTFDFQSRNRRPPKDGTNALLSLAYSLLVKDLTVTCFAVGFDPMTGFYHQPRHGRPALALDLMEPLRPIIADSAVLTAINTRMVTPKDLTRAGDAVSLTAEGRRGFFRAYELRMDTLVTHPLFNYRVSYRRLLEIQARLLAKLFDHEIADYPVFVTK
jgi:CRISPR-associated protein Cas1